MLGFIRALFSSSSSELFAEGTMDVLVLELQRDQNLVRLLEIAGESIGEWPIVKRSVEKRLYKELIDKVGVWDFQKFPEPGFLKPPHHRSRASRAK